MPADVFNLAAIHVTPGHPDGDYYYTNVLGAVNVCRFANDARCTNIVFTSSISIYGPSETTLDEDAQPAPVSAYGRSKLLAEKIHLLWQSEASNRRLTIVVLLSSTDFTSGEISRAFRRCLKKGPLFIRVDRHDQVMRIREGSYFLDQVHGGLQRRRVDLQFLLRASII